MQLLSALLSVIDIPFLRLRIPQLRTANLRSRANPRTNDASSRALQSKVSGSIGYQPVPFGNSPNGTTTANFLTQETKQEIAGDWSADSLSARNPLYQKLSETREAASDWQSAAATPLWFPAVRRESQLVLRARPRLNLLVRPG